MAGDALLAAAAVNQSRIDLFASFIGFSRLLLDTLGGGRLPLCERKREKHVKKVA